MKHLSPQTLRLVIQSAFTAASLWVGWRFFLFLEWVHGNGAYVARPAGVEGFLPISALMGFRRWLTTGQWDRVHPAGLTILFTALLLALLLRKGFCGFVCPVGLVSSLLEKLGKRLGVSRSVSGAAARVLGLPKYLLLGFFLMTILRMPVQQMEAFMGSPYNMVADAKMLEFFVHPSAVSLLVLALLAVLSLVVRNFWCRFLCPYGALLGLVALASPFAVHRDKNSCISCSKCVRACPANIDVEHMARVNTPQCIGCMQCAGACPVQECLKPKLFGRSVRLSFAGLAVAGLFVLAWGWGVATGHWDSGLPASMLRMLYLRGTG